jgi:hypothetical protein
VLSLVELRTTKIILKKRVSRTMWINKRIHLVMMPETLLYVVNTRHLKCHPSG